MIQGAMCLAKFKYYPDVHDKQPYDFGALLGHCRAVFNLFSCSDPFCNPI